MSRRWWCLSTSSANMPAKVALSASIQQALDIPETSGLQGVHFFTLPWIRARKKTLGTSELKFSENKFWIISEWVQTNHVHVGMPCQSEARHHVNQTNRNEPTSSALQFSSYKPPGWNVELFCICFVLIVDASFGCESYTRLHGFYSIKETLDRLDAVSVLFSLGKKHAKDIYFPGLEKMIIGTTPWHARC